MHARVIPLSQNTYLLMTYNVLQERIREVRRKRVSVAPLKDGMKVILHLPDNTVIARRFCRGACFQVLKTLVIFSQPSFHLEPWFVQTTLLLIVFDFLTISLNSTGSLWLGWVNGKCTSPFYHSSWGQISETWMPYWRPLRSNPDEKSMCSYHLLSQWFPELHVQWLT